MNKIEKFLSKERTELMAPETTLKEIGALDAKCVLDYGTGPGLFSQVLAKNNIKTYAYDIDDNMLSYLKDVKEKEDFNTLHVIGRTEFLDLEENYIDHVLLMTVLHELPDRQMFLDEMNHLLSKEGKITIVEFYKKEMKFGPSLDERISEEELTEFMKDYQVVYEKDFNQIFYLMTFSRK